MELLLTFWQDKAMHISNHIQEWCRRKRLIKAFILSEFLLECFLESLLPYIVKDVSTSGVQNEEQAIFRAHKLDLIYAQSGLLYEIIPNAPRSSFDPKIKPGPHADGIVGCTSAKPVDLVTKQVSQLSINQSTSGQATDSSQPTQMTNALSVDVIVTSKCIHLYLLSIVTRCLFRDVLMSFHAPMFLSGGSIM